MITKRLTKDALYALMLMNDNSQDIPFLPLGEIEGQSRKALLTSTLEKGYADLREAGYLEGEEPTDAFVGIGLALSDYCKVSYHIQVDDDFFCAPQVDEYKRMCVVIMKHDDGLYSVEYLSTVLFMAYLMGTHEALQDIDGYTKNYLHSNWETYTPMRFFTYYGDRPAIRLKVQQLGHILQDNVLVKSNQSGLLEYDLIAKQIRSLSPRDLKHNLVQQLKVEV